MPVGYTFAISHIFTFVVYLIYSTLTLCVPLDEKEQYYVALQRKASQAAHYCCFFTHSRGKAHSPQHNNNSINIFITPPSFLNNTEARKKGIDILLY